MEQGNQDCRTPEGPVGNNSITSDDIPHLPNSSSIENTEGSSNSDPVFEEKDTQEIKAHSQNSYSTTSPSPDSSLKRIFDILPENEIKERIFDKLDYESKLNFRLVCKKWKNLIDGIISFSPVFHDNNAKEVLGLSGKVIETLTIGYLKRFKYPPDGIGFEKVYAIELDPMTYPDGTESEGISEMNFQLLLNEFSDIEKLFLHSGVLKLLERPSFLRVVGLNHLRQLRISALNSEQPGFDICVEVLSNTFPSLRCVILNYLREYVETILAEPVPSYYKNIYDFISRHTHLEQVTITKFNCINETCITEGQLVNLNNGIPIHTVNSILEKLKNVQLLEFTYKANCFDTMPQFPFAMELLRAQKRLTTITFERLNTRNKALWQETMVQVFQQCSETLKYVQVDGCICSGEEELFSCTSIAHCSNLKVFQVDICGITILDIELITKNIEKLSLGQNLTLEQINYISTNLTNLTALSLSQGGSVSNPLIPRITLDIFKNVIKLPKLIELEIQYKTSNYNAISEWIFNNARDALTICQGDKRGYEHRMYVVIQIDRTKFSY